MQGTLFKYGGPGSCQLAFKTSPPPSVRHPRCQAGGELHLVLVGGLTDGLLFAPYVRQLADAAGALGWSLVQAQLSSSYVGWGLSSLDQDAAELNLLAGCLAAQHNCQGWVLMGHSTGCQDAVRYVARHGAQDGKLAGVILQAPVSDREYLGTLPAWGDKVPEAQQLVQQGRGEEVVFRAMDWDGAAITARRLVSLCCQGGDDDMFSTDLPLQELQGLLGPLQSVSCLILQSGADEAVPQQLQQSGAVAALGQRMLQAVQLGPPAGRMQDTPGHDGCAEGDAASRAAAAGPAAAGAAVGGACAAGAVGTGRVHRLAVVEGAGHACAGHEQAVVDQVCEFLRAVMPC